MRTQALLAPFLAAHADGPLADRDAPGNFLRHLVGKVPVAAEAIAGRFDVGGLDTYVSCDAYFSSAAAE